MWRLCALKAFASSKGWPNWVLVHEQQLGGGKQHWPWMRGGDEKDKPLLLQTMAGGSAEWAGRSYPDLYLSCDIFNSALTMLICLFVILIPV